MNKTMYRPLEELYDSIYNEIIKHKWVLSERKGFDVGACTAKKDWYDKHFNEWLQYQKQELFRLV